MSGPPLLDLGIREIAAGYRDRSWSPVEVTRLALQAIAETEPSLSAWSEVAATAARSAALKADRDLMRGAAAALLCGVPIGVKDIIDVAGMATRCGSAARQDAGPAPRSAAVVETLLGAGAVVLGKTTTQEFAAGVVSAPARNPWDTTRVPGGSSGGSAVAVAARHCFAALGSDTGGSIRIPAAACGVVGFKPAYGSLDVAGVYPLSWSLDTVGPLARTVDDAWILWRTLLGEAAPRAVAGSVARLRVGFPRDHFLTWLQPDVLHATEGAMRTLQELGATIVETSWPQAAAARAAAFVINRVETAAVHESVALRDPARFARYGPELRLRVAAGRSIPAAHYLHALRARQAVRDAMAGFFAAHRLDALLTPTLPTTAVPAATPVIANTGRAESLGAGWTRLTMPFNATGQPVLAVPAGFDAQHLPISVQIAGRPGGEEALFRIGAALEASLGLTRLQPPASAAS